MYTQDDSKKTPSQEAYEKYCDLILRAKEGMPIKFNLNTFKNYSGLNRLKSLNDMAAKDPTRNLYKNERFILLVNKAIKEMQDNVVEYIAIATHPINPSMSEGDREKAELDRKNANRQIAAVQKFFDAEKPPAIIKQSVWAKLKDWFEKTLHSYYTKYGIGKYSERLRTLEESQEIKMEIKQKVGNKGTTFERRQPEEAPKQYAAQKMGGHGFLGFDVVASKINKKVVGSLDTQPHASVPKGGILKGPIFPKDEKRRGRP